MSKRILSILLLAAMLTSAAACGDTSADNPPPDDSSSDLSTTDEIVDDSPKLAIQKEDNDGKEFTILLPTHARYEYDVEQTGDIVDDAIFNRNQAVEELLGIDFNFVVIDGHWDQRATFINTITNDILSDNGEYDLISGLLPALATSTQEGYYVEGRDLEYCNFDNPWWIQDMYDRFAIEDKLFEFVGDASLTVYKELGVVYFNKRIFDNYGLENPYDLVRSGDWTLDKMIELGTATGNDGGDGVYDYKTDEMGTVAERIVLEKLSIGTDVSAYSKDNNGVITANDLTEKYISVYEKLYNFVYSNDNVVSLNTHDSQTYDTGTYFGEGRFALMINFLKMTEMIRDMNDDFGIVPMPKYDKEQDKYLSSLGTSISVFLVPKTARDIPLTSKVMEALCYYSYMDVTPKYYEVALKEKYSRDDDIKEMLTIIRDGATLNIDFFHMQLFGEAYPRMMFTTGEQYTSPDNLVSTVAGKMSTIRQKLESAIEKYSEIE
ncbi:MAG: hypothetical protein HFE63_05480 [Clostridiales bacterium]|nr:hypothetical protein [Clostridiales bacterium]